MKQSIGPVSLPPHLALYEMGLTMWMDTVMAANQQYLQWLAMPFAHPHAHEHSARFQMEIPEPIEASGEHDLFA